MLVFRLDLIYAGYRLLHGGQKMFFVCETPGSSLENCVDLIN